ncbi:MAG: hypothetical protein LBD64_00760, partial [Odoribacteraceae bacterium]|nr:hypothetical protein [Odoribacteraceae bacterium]
MNEFYLRNKYFNGDGSARIKPARRGEISSRAEAIDVLMDAARCWYALDAARQKAARNERFTFGNQWGDRVFDPARGRMVSEEAHLMEQGVVPLQNNRIRGIVRSVLGVFATNRTEPLVVARDRDEQRKGELMSITMQYAYQLNRIWEIDRRVLEHFLVDGVAISRVSFGYRDGKRDAW